MKFQKEEEILADIFFHLTLKKDLNIIGGLFLFLAVI